MNEFKKVQTLIDLVQMVEIKTESYYVKPSDSRDWLIIGDKNGKEVDVEISTLDYLFKCEPKEIEVDGVKLICSRLCCYTGCYVSMEEIKKTQQLMEKLYPDLQDDAQEILKSHKNQIYLSDDYDPEENVYKIRCAPAEWNFEDEEEDEGEDEGENDDENNEENNEKSAEENDEEENIDGNSSDDDEFRLPPRNHCIFLMKNGYCATHKYFLENNENWIEKKFNICTTFPLDLRPQDNTMAFMSGFDDFAFGEVECLSNDRKLKGKLKYPQIIDEMKDVIIHRFGDTWYNALSQCAKDYRAGFIDVEYIYSDTDLD